MATINVKMNNIGQMLRVFYIDAENDDAGETEVRNMLKGWQEFLQSQLIRMLWANVDGTILRVITDEVLLREGSKVSVLTANREFVVSGNVLFVGCENDTLRSLNADELEALYNNLGLYRVEEDDGTKYNAYAVENVKCGVSLKEVM